MLITGDFVLLENKKGISQFVSRVALVGVSFIILGLLSMSMYNFYLELTLDSIRSDSFALSERIGNDIHDMYSEYSERSGREPTSDNNVTLSKSSINVPDEVAGRNYNLYFNSSRDHWIDAEVFSTPDISVVDTRRPTARIYTEITDHPRETFVYNLYNIEIDIVGQVYDPETLELRYVRYLDDDDEIEDKIVIEEV